MFIQLKREIFLSKFFSDVEEFIRGAFFLLPGSVPSQFFLAVKALSLYFLTTGVESINGFC